MYMKKLLYPVIILCVTLKLDACGASADNESAEENAIAFYNNLKEGNIDAALNSCSNAAFTNDENRDAWKKSLQNNLGLLGNITSYEKTSGWNINKSTESGTTLVMAYDVTYEHGKSTDTLRFIKDDDGVMRIFNYSWIHKDAKYSINADISAKLITSYMEALKAGNYAACYAMAGYAGTQTSTEQQWTDMLTNTALATGAVNNFTVYGDKTEINIGAQGASGPGNYYLVHVLTECVNGKVEEEFMLYQPTYNDAPKIISHQRF
jgi:hypothetical protein